jgi:Protein of unknown function (DUF1573)
MKKLFLLATAFVFGFAAMAQQQQIDNVIKVDMEKYDFGKIKQGVPVTTYFTITNISDKPIVIENAQASCGCTTPEWNKEPIAPNATAKIKVGYNAGAMGTFTKPVTIKLAGIDVTKQVNITGEVVNAESAEITKVQPAKAEATPAVKPVKDTKPAAKTQKKTTTKKTTASSK